MAKYNRRRYHGLGALVTVPGLGVFKESAPLGSVFLGTLVGFGAAVALKALVTRVEALKGNIPGVVQNNMTLVGGLVGAAALYFLGRKSPEKAKGRAFGAVLGTASAWGWDMLRTKVPETFGDLVSLNYGRYGMLVNSPNTRYAGLLVDSSPSSLAALAQSDMAAMDMGQSPEGEVP